MHKKITFACLLAVLPMMVAVPAMGQNSIFSYDANKDFATEIQPGLLEIVRSAEPGMNEFQTVCKRLSVFGDKDAVPALAEKLLVWNYSHFARTALQEMPFPEAGAALRDALGKAKESRLKAGIIDSLGHRQDLKAVPLLLPLLKSDDSMLSIAAATALARIANTPYANDLCSLMGKGDERLRVKFTDICLIYGKTLENDGVHTEAVEVFYQIVRNGAKDYQKEAANFQILLCKSPTLRTYERLAEWLASEDKTQWQAAIRATQFLKNADATAAMTAAYAKVPAEKQAMILASLGDQQNAAAVAFITGQLTSENETLKNAAVLALKNSADFAGFQTLLKTAVTVDGDLQTELISAMAKLPDSKELDAEILEAMKTGSVKQKTVVMNLVALRRTEGALEVITDLEKASTDPIEYSIAMIRAVGEIGTLAELQSLQEVLLSDGFIDMPPAQMPMLNAAIRDAFHASCVRMTDRDAATAIVVDGINKAKDADNKDLGLFFFTMLPVIDGPAAMKAVADFAKSDDRQAQDFATNVMGRWMTVDIAPTLLELANTPDYPYATRALRGYLRLARQFPMEESARRAMIENAEKSPAFTDGEKEIVETIRKQYKL